MYEPQVVPENLNDLLYPEQLTLWSIRYWADGLRQNYSPYETLREAYLRANCMDCFLSLENFLSLLVAHHSRPVDIRCLCCGGISLDEWRILQSLALAQMGRESEISLLISHFLEPATVGISSAIVSDWAQELRDSRLVIPVRSAITMAAQFKHAKSGNSGQKRAAQEWDPATLH